jgi:septal ring factor EnvC (AmiA/AmiB activator)
MPKYLLLICAILCFTPLQAKVDKKKILESQKIKEALESDQSRLLAEVNVLHQRLHELSALQQTKQAQLEKSKQNIAQNMPLLLRLGRVNVLKLLVEPKTGQNTLRSIILVRSLTEALKNQIIVTQNEITEIDTLSHQLEKEEQAHIKLLQDLENQKLQLEALVDSKFDVVKKKELERLASEDDINTLLEESRAALSKTHKSASQAASSQNLPFKRLELPVHGKIVQDSKIQAKYSPKSIGVVFETNKNADVLAPSSGTVVFKGPFKDQGEIVILDHGKSVHSVFMGIDKINAYVGQKVYAREKIGTMAGYGSGFPKLYFELRKKGQAIDPKPYFAE